MLPCRRQQTVDHTTRILRKYCIIYLRVGARIKSTTAARTAHSTPVRGSNLRMFLPENKQETILE